jgi:hypothetical protein
LELVPSSRTCKDGVSPRASSRKALGHDQRHLGEAALQPPLGLGGRGGVADVGEAVGYEEALDQPAARGRAVEVDDRERDALDLEGQSERADHDLQCVQPEDQGEHHPVAQELEHLFAHKAREADAHHATFLRKRQTASAKTTSV